MAARRPFGLVILAGLFASADGGRAQTPTPHVAVRDLTVEDREPPGYLQRALDDHTVGVMGGFDRCFAERSRAVPGLAGELQLSMWVSAQQVIRVTLGAATYTDVELSNCVKRVLLAFHLPPDAPRAGATVRMRVVFSGSAPGTLYRCGDAGCADVPCGALGQACCAGDACGDGVCDADATCSVPPPPPPPPPPPVAIDVTRASGGYTREELAAALSSGPLVACADGSVSGHVPMSVTVYRSGRVVVSALRGTVRDRAVITCLTGGLRGQTLATRTRTTYARIDVRIGDDAAPRPPAVP